MDTETIEWRERNIWSVYLDEKVTVEVSNHGKDMEFYKGNGCWCFYLYIHEKNIEDFERWWLPDIVTKFSFVTHDYDELPLGGVPFHGGVTYYAKHGHSEGKRSVQIGCDYGHLWDSERDFSYSLEDIQRDALRAARALINSLTFKEKKEATA